ncbi:MAG: ATP-binding protein [Verrucomicrobiota bacterium]
MNIDRSLPAFKATDSAGLFNFLLEHISDLIFFKDLDGRFICVNNAVLQLFGLKDAGEIVGKTDFDFYPPEEARRTFLDEQHVMQTGEPIQAHVTRKMHRDGTLMWVFTTKLPLRNDQGEIVGTCGISKDITPLRETEEALERSNKELEQALTELKVAQAQLISAEKSQLAIRLASGVAHEVRNPLNILNTGLAFISSEPSLSSNPMISMVLHEMQDAIGRADNVISTLMEASSPEGLKLEQTNVNTLIEEVVSEMSGKLEGACVKTSLQLTPVIPLVKMDKPKMSQVIKGVIGNALEAMQKGGALCICTRLQELTLDDITRDAGARGGQMFRAGDSVVTIEIADNGPGIPEEVLPRIFDPFFTTKDTGVKTGLGLGLTVCKAIIELHNGSLEITNRHDGPGTRVAMKIKCVARAE